MYERAGSKRFAAREQNSILITINHLIFIFYIYVYFQTCVFFKHHSEISGKGEISTKHSLK